MRHYVGLSESDLRTKRLETPIYYEPGKLINSHLLLAGMSGCGKSFQAVNFLSSAVRAGIEIDAFDSHDELHILPGSKSCMFSQATCYGYNPLELDLDPHTGGVNRQIDFFVRLITEVTPQFGIRQESALRHLLLDTYTARNIFQDDRASWQKRRITEEYRKMLIAEGRQEELKNFYPTLEDLKEYAKGKVVELTIGADNKCVSNLELLTRLRKHLTTLGRKLEKSVDDEAIIKLQEKIAAQKKKCVETFKEFVETMQTGREVDDVLKYNSVDVLISVLQRLTLLSSTGILSANTPPFENSRVRVHQMRSLTHEQQVLYTKLRLQSIFEKYKGMGATECGSELRHIIYIEEAHKFFVNDPNDIINVIAKEARKFGLGLWCASQQPTSFPESFLTNVGATILLGLHSSYWRRAASMFRISENSLLSVKPKEVLAIKMQKESAADPPFLNVVVPNPNNALGKRALQSLVA